MQYKIKYFYLRILMVFFIKRFLHENTGIHLCKYLIYLIFCHMFEVIAHFLQQRQNLKNCLFFSCLQKETEI